jgi:hypothetical protein
MGGSESITDEDAACNGESRVVGFEVDVSGTGGGGAEARGVGGAEAAGVGGAEATGGGGNATGNGAFAASARSIRGTFTSD